MKIGKNTEIRLIYRPEGFICEYYSDGQISSKARAWLEVGTEAFDTYKAYYVGFIRWSFCLLLNNKKPTRGKVKLRVVGRPNG